MFLQKWVSQLLTGQKGLGTDLWPCGDSTTLRGSADPRAHWQEAEGSTSWYKALKCKRMSEDSNGSKDSVRTYPQKDKEGSGKKLIPTER